MRFLLLSFVILGFATAGNADSGFDIKTVSVVEEELTADEIAGVQRRFAEDVESFKKLDDPLTDLGVIDATVDKIISIGSKIWKIVTDNQPVVSLNTQRVSALPSGSPSWLDMEGWSDLEARKFNVVYENVYGMEVVKMSYIITYTHSGSVNGKGRFLSNVGFVISNLEVMWAYNLNVGAEVVRTQNVGTKENPVAALELNLNWIVKTPVKYAQGAVNFYIRGDGALTARSL